MVKIAIPRYAEHNHPKEACKHPPPYGTHRWHHGYGKYVTGDVCACGHWRGFQGTGLWNEPPIRIYRGDSWEG